MQEYTKSALHYIGLVMKWKIQFIIITIIAIIASVLFSSEWFIKPRYKFLLAKRVQQNKYYNYLSQIISGMQ
jgi:hypothetical protein